MLTPTQLCKCLGDDIRLSLICLLHGQGEVCVCDLVEAMQAPQSTVFVIWPSCASASWWWLGGRVPGCIIS